MVLQTRISHTIFLGCDGLAQVLTSEKKISLMYTQTLRGVLTVLNHHRPLCERLDESGRPRGPAHRGGPGGSHAWAVPLLYVDTIARATFAAV